MDATDDFTTYYAELLEGRYDCVDRMVLNAYFSMGQTGGGLRCWWRDLHGDDSTLDDKHLTEMAGTFSRRVSAYCDKHGIPLIEAQAGDRKHELAQAHVPDDPEFQGLFLIITGKAPAPLWEIKHNAKGQIIEVRHRKTWPHVKHYYFHLIDAQWGHITIRMCGYPPFGAQIILNGHEWVEREAHKHDIRVAKSSNCFIEGSDFEAVDRMAATLQGEATATRLHEVCERWIYSTCLCFALTLEEQQRSRFIYQYSVFQLELSRNLLFQRGDSMDEMYQKLIDRTRQELDIDQLKTLFGHTHRPHNKARRGRAPELSKAVNSPSYDLTVFKVKWGNLALKIYDKGERVLRVEVVVHNAKELRCGKVLEKLPILLERMGAMLTRFLDTVQVAHISFLDQGAFEQWSEPTTLGSRRLAGINLDNARNRHVIGAVVGLSTEPDGFTLSQLAENIRARSGDETYSTRNAAYDLTKLRGKTLVRRRKKSRRYEADPSAVRTMCAYLILREQVIKPVLAGTCHRCGRPPKTVHPLDQHYMNLRLELEKTFETLGLAA